MSKHRCGSKLSLRKGAFRRSRRIKTGFFGMDSKSGAILASSGAGLVDGLPGSDEQSVETKPLTEIQVHAVDLSLKSPQLLPPYSQPLHLKDTHGFHSEVKKTSRGQKRGRGSMEVEGEDNAIHTTLKPGVLETSVSNPTLPETDSSATSGKDTHHPSPVVLKDEIEEVCIGDSDGDWHEQSYSPVFLNKISTEDKGSDITSDGNDKVPVDTTATIKEEQEDIVMNDFGFLAKDAAQQKPSVSEGHMLDLTGSTKNESVTGLSAKLNQSIRNCSGKNELSDIIQDRNEEGHGKTGKEEASFPFVLPGCSQGLNKIREKTNEPDREEKENIVKQKMDREGEALNLTLSQKSMWNDRHKMEKYSERTGSESTLVMEVDEIVQRVEEEKDDDAQGLLERGSAVKVNVSDWDPNKSPALDSLRRSPTSSTPEDLDGLLLIDDQGIPYTLTPDGEKVIQVAPSKSCKASTFGQTKLRAKHVEVNDSMAVSSPDCDLPKKSLTETRPCVTSKHVTPQLTTSGSASKIVPHPNNTSTTQTAVITPASLSPTLSNLASQPVQILANPTSNILLVPSSHLPSPSSSTPTSNASLLTLSLPISLNPNPPSAPLFLVLSPLTASSTSPSSSNVNAIDSIPSSLLPTKTQSSASAPVPLSSGKTVIGSSSPSTASLPADTLNSSAPSTCIAGEMSGSISTPNFSSVSSGNTKQPKPDLACKTVFSKSSIITKSDSPCNPDSAFDAENQTDSSTSPVPISPVKIPKSNTSPSTSTPFVPQGSQDSSLPVDQPSPTSDTQADIFPSDQSLYSSSGMPPPMAIFPTNHPKNFSLSSACPRRILYCQYCPRAFYYLSDLERHSITHSQSKPHVCPLCSKAFKRSSHLERHKHIHTGQRNFICPICSKRFREAGELHRHQRVHTGEKPFQCSLCHMRFAERNTLRRHTKRKHHEFNGHGDGDGMPGGPEESAEWYSCAVPDMDSDTEPDKD